MYHYYNYITAIVLVSYESTTIHFSSKLSLDYSCTINNDAYDYWLRIAFLIAQSYLVDASYYMHYASETFKMWS